VGYGPFKVGGSWADAKDNGSVSVGYKGFKVGGTWADNSTVCDSAGNCMVGDSLYDRARRESKVNYADVKDNGSVSVGYGPFKVGGSWADVKDNGSVGIAYKGFKVGGKWADNSTVCDSAGNCMVGDSLYVKRSRCGHEEPNYADVKDNSWSIGGSYGGVSAGFSSLADNSTVCDSRGNCIVRDALYTKGPCITDEEWAAGVRGGPHGLPNGANMGIPAGMNVGIPTGLPNGANMGIPAGMNVGIPAGLPNGANMGIPAGMNMGHNVANMQQMYGY
jgi:uncharacterized Fe-S cluster protein YjdI